MSARINLAAANSAVASRLAAELDLPQFIAATLVARGFDTVEKAQEFLNPCLLYTSDAADDHLAV